jgi:DNA invertase Pin-like site-specific DNA recombinase
MPRARRTSPTSTSTARRVIAYVRVSTDKQAESGLGLEAQREKVRAYCALHDAELVRICEDAGASASTLARPALAEALADLSAGRADALLVLKLDRLTRSTRDLGEVLDRAQREGWALLSVSESLDTSTAAGRLVVGVLGAVAQWEREAIGERTAAAMATLAAAGRYTGGRVPYGSRLAADGTTLEADPAEVEVLRVARELRASGLSLRKIGAELHARGMAPRGGGAWHATAVARLVDAA